MSALQGVIFITFDINTKETEFIRNDNITDYDTNVTNVYVQSKYKNSNGETVYLSSSEIANYNFSLYTIKPLTNNVSEITGVVTNELTEKVRGGVIKFVIPKACTNRSGIVKCELHINKEKEMIASTRFILDVQQSLVTKFNDSLLDDEDFPVLKQLILEIQKTSNIDDTRISKTTTYSSYKIDSQIKENENKNNIQSNTFQNEIQSMNIKSKLFVEKEKQITNDTDIHNAFTSMLKFNDKYVLVYRKGSDHNSFDGKIVMRTSTDMQIWSDETIILQETGKDYRDINLIVFSNKLVLKYVKRWGDDKRKVYINYTTDLSTFNNEVELPTIESGYCASRGDMAIYNNELYCILYGMWDGTYLVKSSDLSSWNIVTKLLPNTDEASIVYNNDNYNADENKFIAIFRQTSTGFTGNFIYGQSYDGINWSYKEMSIKAHCPTIKILQISNYSRVLCVLYRNPSYLKSGLCRSYYLMSFMDVNGNLLRNPYSLFYSTNTFDIGYGDMVIDNDNMYICYYKGNGSNKANIYINTIYYDDVKKYINTNNSIPVKIEKIKYLNASNVLSYKNKYSEILGDIIVAFNNEKYVDFTIDLSPLDVTTGTVTLVSIYAENKFYEVRVNSVSNTSITGRVTYDNTASTFDHLRLRYFLIHRG